MDPTVAPLLPWINLLLVVTVGVLALGWWLAVRRSGAASRDRNRVAQRGEHSAEALLQRAGYRIVDRQVPGTWRVIVDGNAQEVGVRADLVVSLGEQRYVAEIKTGNRAPDPTLPATRRQLLEYWFAYPDHGLLLVDMQQRTIHEVSFPVG